MIMFKFLIKSLTT